MSQVQSRITAYLLQQQKHVHAHPTGIFMTSDSAIQNRHGFTLVELLVALLIMAIGIIATLGLISASMNANTHANILTTKTALAQQVTEDLLSVSPDNQPELRTSTANTVYRLDRVKGTDDITFEGAGTFHAVFSTVINTPMENVTQILITVSMTSPILDPPDPPLKITVYRYLEQT
jgi:type IV pilus assembly protein PilV